MARKKLKKLQNVDRLPNVFRIDHTDTQNLFEDIIKKRNRLVFEIGCGHGDYTVDLAMVHSDTVCIGIDIKGARIYTAARRALNLKLTNAFFLIGNAGALPRIFTIPAADKIIIPFPDPHVKRKSEHRRLVSAEFLTVYNKLLKSDGKVYLKTDNEIIFNYAIRNIEKNGWKILSASDDMYNNLPDDQILKIKTKYEEHYLSENRKIKYICFQKT